MDQILLMKEGECKFNIPLKLRKSFQVNDNEDKQQAQNLGFAAMPEQFKNLNLEPGKYFWGYGNVSKVDMQGDLFPIETLEDIAPGLTQAPYNKVFLNHDYTDIAVGTIIATATDSMGILVLGKINEDHQRAWEIWQSILNGALDGLSMGGSFLEVESYYDEVNDMTITVAKKATGTEMSLTSIPVNGGSLLMGAFQKAQKKFVKKFGEPKMFTKGEKVENRGNFKYNKSQDNNKMDKKDFSEEQKKAYDKAIADGKTEDEALKLVKEEQVDEAEQNVNQDLVGKKKACDKKEIKKSVDEVETVDEAEEVADEKVDEVEATEEEKTEAIENGDFKEDESKELPEDKVKTEEEKPEEKEETPEEVADEKVEEAPEEKEEQVDYKKAFEEMKAKNEDLEKELSNFKKSAPTADDKTPDRESVKTEQAAVPSPSDSSKNKSATPFIDWMKK